MTEANDGTPSILSQQVGRRGLLKGALMLGAAAAAAPVLAACGSAAGGGGSASGGGKTQVKIASWMQFEPGRKDAWKQVLDKFNAQSKNVEAVMVGWPFTQYPNQILTQVQAGGLDADLITAPPDLAARLFSLNEYLPLTGAIKNAKVTPDPNLHAFVMKNGEFYGVSTVTVAFALLYNQKVLDAAGVTPPTTPDEWVAAGTKLTQKPNKFGVIQANTMAEEGSFWFNLQNTVNAYGGLWAQGKTPLVTSQPVIDSLKLFQQLYNTSIPKGLNDAQMMALMGAGNAAMGEVVSATVNVLKSGSPDVYQNLRSVVSPWPSHKGASRVHPISLYQGTQNKDAATEFLSWLFQPENMAMLTTLSLDAIAPYPELNDVPDFKTYLQGLPWLSGYTANVPVTPMDLMGDFITANDEFGNILLKHYQDSLTKGVPVEQTMAAAQTELEALASRLK